MTDPVFGVDGDPAEPWALLTDLDYAPHLTVWYVVLALGADGVERINSTSTRNGLAELTGEIRTRKSILTSLERLADVDVLEATEIDDWRTTERGRRLAEAFAETWGHVLEDDDEHTTGLGASDR